MRGVYQLARHLPPLIELQVTAFHPTRVNGHPFTHTQSEAASTTPPLSPPHWEGVFWPARHLQHLMKLQATVFHPTASMATPLLPLNLGLPVPL